MSDWRSAFPKDFADLLDALEGAGAESLLIGGYAVGFHADPRATKDIDLWIGADNDNRSRVAKALGDFGAPASIVRDVLSLGEEEGATFGSPPGRVDLLRHLEGMPLFEEAYAEGIAMQDGSKLRILSLDHLMLAKELSSKSPTRSPAAAAQDRADLVKLRSLAKEPAKTQTRGPGLER